MRPVTATALAIGVAGAALRTWQYLGNPSLWLDEAFLANSVLERPLRELLTQPLQYGQSAPKGFLLVERIVMAALGPSDLALRAFPFVCSVAALPFVWAVARRMLTDEGAVAALSVVAFSPGLVRGIQVKPYSSDVLACAVVLLAGLELLAGRRLRTWAVVGAIVAWFSQPAAFVLCGVGAVLVLHDRRRLDVASAWAASALLAGFASLRALTPESHGYLRSFWTEGWLPLSSQAPQWLVAATRRAAGDGGFGLYPATAFVASAAAGVLVLLAFRDRWRLALLVAPLAIALASSAMRVYPLAGRLVWFTGPMLAVFVGATVEWVCAEALRHRSLSVAFAIPTLAVALLLRPVYRLEDIRPAFEYLQREHRQGDALYVFYAAEPAFRRYSSRFDLSRMQIIVGGALRTGFPGRTGLRPKEALDLDRAIPSAERTWILVSHEDEGENELLLSTAAELGCRTESRSFGGVAPARVHLCDRRAGAAAARQ